MKKLVFILGVFCAVSLSESGLFVDKGKLSIAGKYYSGTSPYSGIFAEYKLADSIDVYGGASFPKGYTPYCIGASIYILNPKKESPIALWLTPEYMFYSQTWNGFTADTSVVSIEGRLGYKLSLPNIEILPYVGVLRQIITVSISGSFSGFSIQGLSLSGTIDGSLVGAYVKFSPMRGLQLITDVCMAIRSAGDTSTTVGLGFVF